MGNRGFEKPGDKLAGGESVGKYNFLGLKSALSKKKIMELKNILNHACD
ncbi:MAG: hypothetical protein C5S41_10460 [Candidatus Methanomarinus sp.]|jgi:hypothetical protein|nr:MAG: hypothetical protein C5S41_10460 [ANME-2 cluster archaeon]